MINAGIDVAFVAVSTVCTAVIIGLGFLSRPGRATAAWAFGFSLAMISSYCWVLATASESEMLRAMAAAILLSAAPWLWVGLRARRDADHYHWAVALVFTVAVPAVLGVSAGSDVYSLLFRAVYVGSTVFAVLILHELLKLDRARQEEGIPLAIVSGGYLVFGIVTLVDGVVRAVQTGTFSGEGLELVRELNGVGALVYLVCAAITTILLSRAAGPRDRADTVATFTTVAGSRLQRAEAAGDRWWSVLDIRLDDPVDIRDVSSGATYERIVARFAEAVSTTMPPDADLDRRGEHRFVVLLPRHEAAVISLLTTMLARVTEPDPEQPLTLRLSASVGWAGVAELGYDLPALASAASRAAEAAQARGGDQWERATPVEA